jgi:hypothetical protein
MSDKRVEPAQTMHNHTFVPNAYCCFRDAEDFCGGLANNPCHTPPEEPVASPEPEQEDYLLRAMKEDGLISEQPSTPSLERVELPLLDENNDDRNVAIGLRNLPFLSREMIVSAYRDLTASYCCRERQLLATLQERNAALKKVAELTATQGATLRSLEAAALTAEIMVIFETPSVSLTVSQVASIREHVLNTLQNI